MPRHGGRTKGTPNKVNSTMLEQVEQEAGAPLPVVLTRIGIKAMERKDHHLAVTALTKAMAYTYPRMQTVAPVQSDDVSDLLTRIPMLTVIDGKAEIPPNWPGLTINVRAREKKDAD